jgi:predicted N-acetyltransferase YhbS
MSYDIGYCRDGELDDLTELANRVFRGGHPGDMGEEYPLLFDRENLKNLRVARSDGKLVAHVGICIRDANILGARLRVASIGSVGTDPDHRGHGLASQLMDDARRRSLEEGVSLMLISGSRGLYHRLGYVQVGCFHIYTVPAGETDPDFSITEFEDDDLPALVGLHQAEPVRFFRPEEDWRRVLAIKMLMNQLADLLVVRHRGAVAAYAGVQRAASAPAGPQPARIREIAGSRSALAAVLPGIAQRYGLATAELITWPSDVEWRTQAALRGWTCTARAFPGTLGIIDPERFLQAIRPLLAERTGTALRVEPCGDGARLEVDGASLTLETMGQLTALVFGGETEEARALPEIPSALRAGIAAAFPLPLLWYGYNYV